LAFPAITRLTALATVIVAVVALASSANAEIYTLTFTGNSDLVPVKSSRLPGFKGIKKIKVEFASSAPLMTGQCSQAQTGYPGSWHLVSFTDGVNTYTQGKGFSSPLSPTWVGFDWAFEACLNSASQLTYLGGQVVADSSTNSTADIRFLSLFYNENSKIVYVGYGSAQQGYQGQYGLSIAIDNAFNSQTATVFDAYNGRGPTITYKP